jgi:cell division septation protein DedD
VISPEAAWGIQMVSLSNRKDVDAVWTRLQKANSDLLGGLKLRVQTAKLKKGVFYRVQAGPLADRAAAAALCGTLKSRKQDCLVVAPKR